MSCTLILCSTSAERCVHDNKPASYRFTPATGRFHFDRSYRVRAPSRRAVKSFQQGNGAGVVRARFRLKLDTGTWSDFEAEEGGGVLALVMREQRLDKAGALAWLEQQGFLQRRE